MKGEAKEQLLPPVEYNAITNRKRLAVLMIIQVCSLLWLSTLSGSARMDGFRRAYAGNIALQLASRLPEALNFMKWNGKTSFWRFSGNYLVSEERTEACKGNIMRVSGRAYGLQVPQVTTRGYLLCDGALIALLGAVAWGGMEILPSASSLTSTALLVALVLYSIVHQNSWLMLGSQGGVSGHAGLTPYHILAVLALRPSGELGLACVQWLNVFFYFSAAVAKMLESWRCGRQWAQSETILFYFYQNVFLRPLAGLRKDLREGIIKRQSLMAFGAWSGLIWEAAFILAPLAPRLMALSAVVFHTLVYLLSDIEEFFSLWTIALGALATGSTDWAAAARELEGGDATALLAVAYTAVHALVGLSCWDLYPDRFEVAPFSCYPLFSRAPVLWGPESELSALFFYAPDGAPMTETYYTPVVLTTPVPGILTGWEAAAMLEPRFALMGRLHTGDQFYTNVRSPEALRRTLDEILDTVRAPMVSPTDWDSRVRKIMSLAEQCQHELERSSRLRKEEPTCAAEVPTSMLGA